MTVCFARNWVTRKWLFSFGNTACRASLTLHLYFVDEWITEQEENQALPRTRRDRVDPGLAAEIARLKARPHHRGNIFVRLYDTSAAKIQDDMPYQGVFEKPYIFIILVCAAGTRGFGSYLMDMAYKLAYELGCSTVALSALPDPAGFYYGKHGFRFASRDGNIINIENTPWHQPTENGVRLVPNLDVEDTVEQELRRFVQDRIAGDDARKKRNRKLMEEPGGSDDLQPDEVQRPPKRPGLLQYLASMLVG